MLSSVLCLVDENSTTADISLSLLRIESELILGHLNLFSMLSSVSSILFDLSSDAIVVIQLTVLLG